MAIRNEEGVPYSTATITDLGDEIELDPVYAISENVYEDFTYPGDDEPNQGRRLKYHAGQVITKAQWEALSAQAVGVVTIDPISPQTGTVGDPITPIELSGETTIEDQTLTWSVDELPDGLELEDGVISGTPEEAGESTTVVTATDTSGATGTAEIEWTISAE